MYVQLPIIQYYTLCILTIFTLSVYRRLSQQGSAIDYCTSTYCTYSYILAIITVHHAKMILRCPKTGNRDVSYFNLDSKESVSNFDPDQVKISFLFVLTNGAKMSSE